MRVISMCEPMPSRRACSLVCRSWSNTCADDHFFIRVLPVERLEETEDDEKRLRSASPIAVIAAAVPNNVPGTNSNQPQLRVSLRCALQLALPGETLILGPGHYWEDGRDLVVEVNIRVVGDAKTPGRVIVELGGALHWCAHSGVLIGITFRRPRTCLEATSALVVKHGRLVCHRVIVDNLGAGGAAVTVHQGACVHLDRTTVVNAAASGIFLHPGAQATLSRCNLDKNSHYGLSAAPGAICFLKDCLLAHNDRAHITALAGSIVALKCNDFSRTNDVTCSLIQDHNAFVVARRNVGIDDSQ
jgi:hypothetical protein